MFQRVLTTEFIDGVKVNDLEGMKKLGLNLQDVSLPRKLHVFTKEMNYLREYSQ